MDQILKRFNLLSQIFEYLRYSEISKLRAVSRNFKDKIDNKFPWTQMIREKYTNVYYLEDPSPSVSLHILSKAPKSLSVFYQNSYTVGIIGSLGTLIPISEESEYFSKSGFLGSLSFYCSKEGFNRISLVSIPSALYAKKNFKLIKNFLFMADGSQPNWESQLKNDIKELKSNGIQRLIIIINTKVNNKYIQELISKYEVVFVTHISRDSINSIIRSLDSLIKNISTINDTEIANPISNNLDKPETPESQKSMKPSKNAKKEKCIIY
jgi:F-box domain